MYDYFVGYVTYVSPFYIVLEVNGVGYKLQLANPFRFEVSKEKQQKIYVYQAIRDTDITLFGFSNQDEKLLFEKLIKVSGIGPKSALAILANNDHAGLINAIKTDDVGYLTKFPGVGKKTAQQIVLDLKGKLTDLTSPETIPGQQSMPVMDETLSPYLKETLAALLALGYKEREVKAITKPLKTFSADSTDAYLSEALRLLMKG
ncbi:Holliday junction branch migration protein RuvA [Loigolactobacillus backii]|uniref:Holliday junction branch migration complex subunit RuvA n=1 Tax=Loigolactobacillus backii TaxID=375175 RepID=A0A192H3R6_9LACO|nr:Holliday junction branch migration protein RuvA [Loigolactobacillus backii]ANK59189.1 Holliday junction ATP-dependent DNA helicase RuvA [Loigolactobacillus backii]ANK62601.1 Holliday junction ATP-dependent DNA helicase RuvA [Loigolactobacillus backii]ANK64179.1 Holliday junction ATP-dependent DNA helicase RuvA [Loigolactobacillus backii]ANK67426.1 Holliday junction DNA helicase RuvA [Loigolactobacillus backii]ANK70389.1 Holliday junction ATP-dependent DNA helicase RuvA [Loigolactobacillus b